MKISKKVCNIIVLFILILITDIAESKETISQYTITNLSIFYYSDELKCVACDINNVNQVIGVCQIIKNNPYQGYIWNDKFTLLNMECYPVDINNHGDIVGVYQPLNDYYSHGFIFIGSECNSFNYPGSINTWATGINDAGIIVGFYQNKHYEPYHGFIYKGGQFATLDAPGSVSTNLYGINNDGTIVGGSDLHGSFIYKDGNFSFFGSAYSMPMTDITNTGKILINGYNIFAGHFGQSYIYENGLIYSIDELSVDDQENSNVIVGGINDNNKVVGWVERNNLSIYCFIGDLIIESEPKFYNFRFDFANGDYYTGIVYCDEEYRDTYLKTRYDEHGQIGEYRIIDVSDANLEYSGKGGQVYVNSYFDKESGKTFTGSSGLAHFGSAVGTDYLGSEVEYVIKDQVLSYRFGGKPGYDPAVDRHYEADVNFALIYSGARDAQHYELSRYKLVVSLYQFFTDTLGLDEDNVYVLAADGQGQTFFGWDIVLRGGKVLPATKTQFNATMTELKDIIGPESLFTFCSNSHAGIDQGHGFLSVWGPQTDQDFIWDTEFGSAVRGLPAKNQIYLFEQCFAEAMVDDLNLGPGKFAAYAARDDEVSYISDHPDFLEAWMAGVKTGGLRSTQALGVYALRNDYNGPFQTWGTYQDNYAMECQFTFTYADQKEFYEGVVYTRPVEHPGYQGYDFDICQGGSGSYVQGPAVQAKDTQDTIYYKGQKWSHATEDGLQGEYEIKAMRSVEDDQEKKIDYVYGQVIVSLYHDRESNHNVTPAQSKTACGQNFLGSERNYIYNAIPECYFGAGELNGQKVICEADPPPISFSFNSYADDITDYKVVEITLLGANYLFSLGFLEAKEAPSPVFDRPLFSSLQVILEQGQDQGLNWLKYFYQSNYTNGLSCLGVGYHTEADGWYYLQNAGNSQSYAIGKYVKTAQDSQGSSYQFANVFSTGEVYQGSGYSGTSSGYFSFNPTAILHPTLWSQYGNLSQGNFYSTYYSPFWILNQGSSLLMDFY